MALAQEKTIIAGSDGPYRVMVVDDSAVIRGLISRIIEADPMLNIVLSASNGSQAIRALPGSGVEVIILDIEMPVMDGLTAIPRILEIDPGIKIIMASTLTQRNAQISFKALSAGATDYIPKPSATRDISQCDDFHRELREKVKTLGQAYRAQGRSRRGSSGLRVPAAGVVRLSKALTAPAAVGGQTGPVMLRKSMGKRADILAIGSSTGGPQALLKLLMNFDRENQLPILITQHMPPTFTTILAEHIARASGRPCSEGKDGQIIADGNIYLAPGDWHMIVEAHSSGAKVLRLNQNPPVNFCRPAVDPMFESIASAYDGHVLSVVLTGMGQDGLDGGRKIVARGGTVIAQDEATSVVWGMPGAVATAGLCAAVLPLEKLSGFIHDFPKRAAR